MHTLLQDLRYSLRQLIHTPGFALAAVVSLALGIGATVAVFSVVWAVLMNPYPYRAPDRMVHTRLRDNAGGEDGTALTASQWQIIRKSPAVEDAFMTDQWSLTVTGHDLPEDVQGDYMTSIRSSLWVCPRSWDGGFSPRTRSTVTTRSRSWC
jgi:putative ABC transport system permease protein